MAEAESTIFQPKRPQETQPRFLPSFLYKAVFFVAIIAIIPFFPSQPPESVSQPILSRGWELLQLLLVGVAISYGLFSRRNADHPDSDKERDPPPPPPPPNTPQSFVFGLLQVSSVFDDDEAERSDTDTPSGVSNDRKIQSWSHRYHRGDPVVVVADGGRSNAGENGKPLCLPVRSLKSHPHGSEFLDSCNEIDGLVSDGMDDISRGSFRDSDEVMEGVVLPSPIPWRSRSGRFEVKNSPFAGIDVMPPSVMDAESAPGRARSLGSASVAKLQPLPSQSSELSDKSSEDSVKKKKSFSKVSPPPPPPPPPPISHGSPYLSDRKDTMSRRSRSSLQVNDVGMDPLRTDTRPRNHSESSPSPSTVRSVRTVRWKDIQGPVMEKTTETAINHQLPTPVLSPNHEKNGELDKVIVEPDDSETDSDDESSDAEDAASSAVEAGPDENEVDKKADEFIAKFREQIRLQRIESIKRSTGQRSVRNPN